MPENKQVKQDRPGAPVGNANHLKHGFYSRQFKGIIQHDLDGHTFTGLTDEITALRVFLRQTLELIGHPTNAKHALDCLRSLSAGFYSLTRLVRTQVTLNLSGNDTNSLLEEALEEMRAEEADSKVSEQAAMYRLPKYGIPYPKFVPSLEEGDPSESEEGEIDLKKNNWM